MRKKKKMKNLGDEERQRRSKQGKALSQLRKKSHNSKGFSEQD